MSDSYTYSKDEEYVNSLILKTMQGIKNLNGRRLKYNTEELAQATHVLQNFVRQGACHRLGLFEASDWWGDDD